MMSLTWRCSSALSNGSGIITGGGGTPGTHGTEGPTTRTDFAGGVVNGMTCPSSGCRLFAFVACLFWNAGLHSGLLLRREADVH